MHHVLPRLHMTAGTSHGPSTAVLVLHPAELGAMTVTLHLSDGVLDLSFSGSPLAQSAVREAMGALRHQVAAAGVEVGQVSLQDATPGDLREHTRQPASDGRHAAPAPEGWKEIRLPAIADLPGIDRHEGRHGRSIDVAL